MGTGVSAKHFKKAVSRNRIKRLIRESYRLQNGDLESVLQKAQCTMRLFVIYTEKTMPEYQVLSGKMNVVLQKLKALVVNND